MNAVSTASRSYFSSSVFKKQIVAVTGLGMVGFILMHLSGNLLVFAGPEAFNGYSEKLHALGELLWVARGGLLLMLVLHVYFTIQLVRENRQARGSRYDVDASKRGDATKLVRTYMILTGVIVFGGLMFHLTHFAIPSKGAENVKTFLPSETGEMPMGLYGLVVNAYSNPLMVLFYIVFVAAVGAHLTHGIQSLFQSIGFHHDRYTPHIQKASIALGVLVALGFSSIPVFILLSGTPSV
jgi:succinate dehydrogenase / fumarate reductase cytochrome b subunit